MSYQVVADEAGYVIRDNGRQIAWCADGDVADAVADGLELVGEGIKAALEQLEEYRDELEVKLNALEETGADLELAADAAVKELRDTPAREALELALRAWRKARNP